MTRQLNDAYAQFLHVRSELRDLLAEHADVFRKFYELQALRNDLVNRMRAYLRTSDEQGAGEFRKVTSQKKKIDGTQLHALVGPLENLFEVTYNVNQAVLDGYIATGVIAPETLAQVERIETSVRVYGPKTSEFEE